MNESNGNKFCFLPLPHDPRVNAELGVSNELFLPSFPVFRPENFPIRISEMGTGKTAQTDETVELALKGESSP